MFTLKGVDFMFRNDHDTYDRYSSYDSYGQEARIAGKQRYFAQTYGLMAGALAVTFLVALATARSFPQVAASSGIVIFLCIAQLVLVFSLSRSLTRGNTTSTLVKFLLYAAFTGVSFSSIFLYFRAETLVLCFLATAASFGGMALYGLYSKRDILSWGGTLFGGLIGLLVLMLLGFFLSVPTFHLFISVLGVLVFMGMTAYDTRKLSLMYDHAAGTRVAQAYSIYGAFQLYLDFINLFLYLVRLIGLTDRD